jgi:hypothetical protein
MWRTNPATSPHTMESAIDQTGKTAEIEAAVRRAGTARDPKAVAAATRAKMIGRPELQRKAAAARRGDAQGFISRPNTAMTGTNPPIQQTMRDTRQSDPLHRHGSMDALKHRFKLYDSDSGLTHDLDKPLPFARSAPAEDDWAGGGTDPMTRPAMEQTQPASGGLPSAMRSRPRRPTAGPPMQNAQMNGPRLTQSYSLSYPDGSKDERKVTRPAGMSSIGQGQSAPGWGAPDWGHQQDQHSYPTARTVGVTAKGTPGGTPRL